ncbi:MAG: hypothetical protein AB1Z98_25305 [Nannocystaceae bacterium]
MLAAGYLAVVLAGGPVETPPQVERASGSWLGRRDRLEHAGLKLEGFITADWSGSTLR